MSVSWPWRGALALLATVAGFAAAPVQAMPEEGACATVVEDPGGTTHVVLDPTLHVLAMTRRGPFRLPAAAGRRVLGITCGRRSIVPAANDYKVVAAGYPFSLVADDARGSSRVAVLEAVAGRLRFRALDGAFSMAERRSIAARLRQLQNAYDAAGRTRR